MTGERSAQPSANGGLSQDEQLANRLARVSSDMQEVQNYLAAYSALLSMDSGHPRHLAAIPHALLSAAIVSYSRGFLKSDSSGKACRRLEFRLLPIAGVEWAAQLHEMIINRRNQAVAHADWEHHNTELVESTDPVGGPLRVRSVANIYQSIDLNFFRALAASVEAEADAMRYDLDRGAQRKHLYGH